MKRVNGQSISLVHSSTTLAYYAPEANQSIISFDGLYDAVNYRPHGDHLLLQTPNEGIKLTLCRGKRRLKLYCSTRFSSVTMKKGRHKLFIWPTKVADGHENITTPSKFFGCVDTELMNAVVY
ncbi:hypothetical protein SeLEV6574_g02184 [Synchytrium endobioticum]|uniref:Uncharacterized protein n=1 Tax=Synchytrium endobioticum TaxID=286115 RepID=A0A507D9G9_9FUNG|nr:hypothetical protein SeLEV6574_g02157 [Synchytrium endobioticum]TPX48213.1 hypothetical protein SeLEV6574_g02184 [Synchytrium endobioticum]